MAGEGRRRVEKPSGDSRQVAAGPGSRGQSQGESSSWCTGCLDSGLQAGLGRGGVHGVPPARAGAELRPQKRGLERGPALQAAVGMCLLEPWFVGEHISLPTWLPDLGL